MKSAFWPYARRMLRYRALVLGALVFAALSAGGLGAGLLGIKPVVENILADTPKGLPDFAREFNATVPTWAPQIPASVIESLPAAPKTSMVWIMIGLGLLTVFGATCNFLHAFLSLTVISRTVANIRREAFHRVVHLPLKTVVRTGPSDLVSRIVYDTAQLGAGFNALLSRAMAQILKGFAAFLAAWYLNWKLTVITIPVAIVLGIILKKIGKRIRRASKKALASQSGLYQSAGEVLSGLRVVKVHTTERTEAARFHQINKQVVSQEFKVRTARALASPIIETISIVVLGILALIAVHAILDGVIDKTSTLMALGSLGLAAAQLKPLTGFLNDIQQSSAAAARMDELLAMEPEPGHDNKLPNLPRHAASITFDGVAITYPGNDKPALRGVSLNIRFGQTVAFVGPNGCGKTTLLSLVPRLFDPDAGRVLIDDQDIAQFSIRSVRRHIGVVTQETVLFTGTIRDNISYGTTGVTDEQIKDAARRARAEEFILQKPEGYDFVIGENGAGLSGGQRQRIAIARAILRDPAILILDEATSMIDAESEARITEALAEFVSRRSGTERGRTCLVVAHRLSTVIAADAIVVMDQGSIVDIGTHEELLGRCELYRSLVHNQMVRSR